MMDGLDTTEQDVKINETPTLAKEENVEGVKATTVSINGLSTTNKKIIEDIEATTVTMDKFTAEIPEDPEILDQPTEVTTKEGVTTLSPKEPILDTSNEATTAAGEREETSLAGETVEIDGGMEVGETSTTDQPSIEGDTTTKQTEMKKAKSAQICLRAFQTCQSKKMG